MLLMAMVPVRLLVPPMLVAMVLELMVVLNGIPRTVHALRVQMLAWNPIV
jgi:hypothetical protein